MAGDMVTDEEVEKMARKLCAADGLDPDWRKPVSYASHTGKNDGTGSHTVMVDGLAPPAWEQYKHLARAALSD